MVLFHISTLIQNQERNHLNESTSSYRSRSETRQRVDHWIKVGLIYCIQLEPHTSGSVKDVRTFGIERRGAIPTRPEIFWRSTDEITDWPTVVSANEQREEHMQIADCIF